MPGTSQTGGDICERRRAEIAGQVVSGTLSIQDACTQNHVSPQLLLEWVAALRQASLTAFDEQVRRTLAPQGIDVSALGGAEFVGDLGEFAIADLIQTLTLGDRDGVITVSHQGHESRIWCAGGQLIDAESGRLTGTPAVHRMLALEQGRVRASFHRVQRERRVHGSTMELLLDGARRADECRVLRQRLGTQAYRSVAPLPAAASSAEAVLLRRFQAPRRVADALAESERGDLETLTELSRLVERGWLVTADSESVEPPAALVSNPPVMLSLARFPTQPATPRAHRRWALAAGLLVLALFTVPRYLLASRARPEVEARSTAATPALEQAALPASAPAEAAAAPGADREPAGAAAPQLLAVPLQQPWPASAALPELSDTEQRPHARSRSRRRAAGSASTAAAAAPAAAPEASPAPPPSAAGAPAAASSAHEASSAPRMRVIEERRPQMQILE